MEIAASLDDQLKLPETATILQLSKTSNVHFQGLMPGMVTMTFWSSNSHQIERLHPIAGVYSMGSFGSTNKR